MNFTVATYVAKATWADIYEVEPSGPFRMPPAYPIIFKPNFKFSPEVAAWLEKYEGRGPVPKAGRPFGKRVDQP